MAVEIAVSVLIVELGQTYVTPFSIELNPGTYTLRATYDTATQEKSATIIAGAKTTVEFTFAGVTFTLSIRATTGGTTNPVPGDYVYNAGTVVPVTAVPNTGYQLDHWLFDGESIGKADTVNVTMSANHTLQAVFVIIPPPPEYTLSIATTTGGTTNPAPGTYRYAENTSVQVTAIPNVTGYNFDHWVLDGINYTANPITVVMNKDHTLTAYFSTTPPPPPETYNLTIVATTGGTTTPAPGTYEYNAGTIVTVAAVPNEGYKFKRFELDGEVKMQNPVNVGMDADHTLLAVFEAAAPPISPLVIAGVVAAIGAGTAGYAVTRRKR